MNTVRTMKFAGMLVALSAGAPVLAQQAAGVDDPVSAIASGEAGVTLRYRYEFVDQESFVKDANASTMLLRLNYETAAWRGWSSFLEFDHVFEVLSTSFNSGAGTSSPRRDEYPVVADPKGPDLNQFYLQFTPSDTIRARAGRQRILLDDQRYVGGVGWRQNEQTYDGASILYKGIPGAEIFYSYVANVNRIFGTSVPAGDHRQDTHLLNGRMALGEAWKLVGYAYVIDNEDEPSFSTSTFGIRATGSFKSGDSTFDLLGEIATQSDNANNPANFDTGYIRLQGTWSLDRFSAGVGFESLGSDNGQGFRTPLATLHAFNGWADLFLATPGGGLEDLYLKGGFKPGKWNLQLIYHDFSAEAGGGDYGSEVDFSASRKLGSRYDLLVKFARFSADNAAFQDTTKFWLMLTAGF